VRSHFRISPPASHDAASQPLPRPDEPVGPPDPVHDDEVLLLREDRAGAVRKRGAEASRGVHQAGAAGRLLPRRLHRGRVLRRGVAPGGQPGVQAEQQQGCHRVERRQRDGLHRALHARPAAAHPHGGHAHRPAVGHLRRVQGVRGCVRLQEPSENASPHARAQGFRPPAPRCRRRSELMLCTAASCVRPAQSDRSRSCFDFQRASKAAPPAASFPGQPCTRSSASRQ
jgi:hypothetical protein